jgi:hypothetical protein
MSCGIALSATLFLSLAGPADGQASFIPASSVTAPVSVAGEPMFVEIVNRARRLKAEADGFRQAPGLDAAPAPVAIAGFDRFQAELADLAAMDMQGHLELAKRGTDGDLKCILKGIAQDLPVRMQEFAAAKSGAQQKAALAEMAYLLNDNVEVILAPPKPPV